MSAVQPYGESVVRVCADNPGPMTLDGTNTWLLHRAGAPDAVVVDPGPDDPAHVDALLAVVRQRSARVALVLVTHHHADHTGAVAGLLRRAGAAGPCALRGPGVGPDAVGDGEDVGVGGVGLLALATPGHTADSVAYHWPDEGLVLTGDTVLGRGPSVVAHPDGALAPYLASLRRLAATVERDDVHGLLPGHGPIRDDPARALEDCLRHREARLEQVRAAVTAGAATPREVVERVYADVDRALWPAAEASVRAQLDYLRGPRHDRP